MKKLTPIIILCLCLLCNLPVNATSNALLLTNNTTNSIYYETRTLEFIRPLADSDAIYITQEVTYTGIVNPSESLPWCETLDGTTYIGTLYLFTFYYTESDTIAIYKGTLYKE